MEYLGEKLITVQGTKLVQNDVNPLHVAQLTGHKCLKSLDSYSKASLEQQKRMSRLISGHSQPVSNITNTAPASNSSVTATTKSNHSSESLLPGMQIYGNNTVNVYIHDISQSVSYSNSPKRQNIMDN